MSFGLRRFFDLAVPVAIGLWAFLRRPRRTGLAVTAAATAWSVLLMLAAIVGTVNLSRFVSWDDLGTAAVAAGSFFTAQALRSPITSPPLAVQWVVAIAILCLGAKVVWRLLGRLSGVGSGLAFAWVLACLVVALITIVPTGSRAAWEAMHFNLAGPAARSGDR